MKSAGVWKQYPGKYGHTRMLKMRSHHMMPIYNFEIPYGIEYDPKDAGQ